MKQARLAAGWLKQKSKLLPVLFVIVLVGTLCAPAFIPRASATVNSGGDPGGKEAMWLDNYKTLAYSGDTFKQMNKAPKVFVLGGQGCADTITFASTNFSKETKATYQMWSAGSTNQSDAGSTSNCTQGSTFPVTVNPQANNPNASANTTTGTASAADTSNSDVNQSDPCDASSNPLSWFVCPVIGLINEGVIQMQKVIDNLMQVNVGDVFNYKREPGQGYYAAWNTFRLFGVVLIVIAGLLMVISQALGWDVFDAYTVKKVLPRLFVAAIGISLSWWLMKYLAQLTNDLGIGIRSVIYYPFRTLGGSGLQSTGSYIYSLLIGAVTYLILGAGGLLSLVVTAFLAALVAFLVLIIRQLVLIFLIVIAPIAIACYVLPNTEKVYKLWWDSLFKGMLMFPIITGFIAMGRVFSVVASNSHSGAGAAVNQIIALIAFFLPYFALPFTFRLAGGAMATIGGMANDRSRGAFDRLKKYRGAKSAENFSKMKSGSRFSDRNMLTRGFNRTTAGVASGYQGGFGLGERGRQSYDIARRNAALNEVMKSPGWNAIQHNDDALMAATYDSVSAARSGLMTKWGGDSERVESAIAAAKASIDFGRPQAIAAAQQLFTTGTGYKNLEEAADTIGRASGGNAATIASIAGFGNAETKRAGRHDLAPGYAKLNDLSRQAAGLGHGGTTFGEATEAAWASGSLYQHANDKGTNIENAINHHVGLLSSPDVRQREKAAVFFNELRSMQPNATGDVKNKIQDALDSNRGDIDNLYNSAHVNYLGDSPTGVADKSTGSIETMRRNPANGDYEKEVVSTGRRNENARERVERLSRTYERPDPNNI